MTDSELRQDIVDELEFDPSFDGEHIGVAVDNNVVSLSGHVNSYAEKVAAIAAVQRVNGVHAIAENIEVHHTNYEPPIMNIKDILLGLTTYPKSSNIDAIRWAVSFAVILVFANSFLAGQPNQ